MAHKRIIVVQALLMVGLVMAAACKRVEAVAKVNDEAISKKDFQEQVDRNMARYRGGAQQLPPGIEARIQESVLKRMVDDEIITQKAKALELTVTEQEIDTKFKEHKDRFQSDQAFQDYLKRSNNSEANLRDDLRRGMLRDRVVEKLTGNIEATDADVQKYYTDNAQRFHDPEQIKARRIVVRLPQPPTPADKKRKESEAKKLRAVVTKPGTDFGKVAREHSEGPEAPRDGDMGGFFGRGRMPPDFDKVAFALNPNQISDISETKLGYEIIQVTDKKAEKQKPFDEVKDNIRTALLARMKNDKRRDVLRDLKASAKIETLIKFDIQPPPAVPGGMAPAPVGGGQPPAPPPAGGMAPPRGGAPSPPPAGGAPPPVPPAPPPPTALPPAH